jgi:outer membrane protein TolC/ketosteroid isomerase-like protein
VAILALASGCAVTPKPLTRGELSSVNESDRVAIRRIVPEVSGLVTLEEAIARALKHNLDHRVKMLEQAQATGQLEAGRFDMMPRLLADAGYAWRDKDSIRSSEDQNGNIINNQYVSSDRQHGTANLEFHWNVLDFGIGYYNAKENADRVLIAVERRRRAMHTLIQNVRTLYWRAAAADKLGQAVQTTIKEAEAALNVSRKISGEMVMSPEAALRYQRNLLENLRLLENVDRELAIAHIELAGLIGAAPGQRIRLAESTWGQPLALDVSAEQMEELALSNNADLREKHYDARIAAIETRRTLLKLLPNLSFVFGAHHDDDRFLVSNRWADAGYRVSHNLLGIFSAPSRMRAAKGGVQLAEARRMALQMGVLTQVHLARQQYTDALRQYVRASDIYQVDNRLAQFATGQQQSQVSSELTRISAAVTSILSEVRRYQAMAKVHEAASRIQASVGLEPTLGNVEDIELGALAVLVREDLGRILKFGPEPVLAAPPAVAKQVPAPKPAAPPVAQPHAQIMEALNRWRDAWTKGDVAGYLASYSVDFRPARNQTRQAWEAWRSGRLRANRNIRIELADIAVTDSKTAVSVAFEQRFSSTETGALVDRKTLIMRQENGQWKILEESVK